jgi:hypothetical protein
VGGIGAGEEKCGGRCDRLLRREVEGAVRDFPPLPFGRGFKNLFSLSIW